MYETSDDEKEEEDSVQGNDSTKSKYPLTNAMKANKGIGVGFNPSRDASPLRNIAPKKIELSDDGEEVERLKEEINDLKDLNMKLLSKSAAPSVIASGTTPHTGSSNSNDTDVLKTKIESLNSRLKESEKSMQEMKIERDEKINENAKLLKELLDIKMNAVPVAKDTEYWKMCCTDLKLNLQSYASRLTAMEVQLAVAEVNYADTSLASPTSKPPSSSNASASSSAAPSFSRQTSTLSSTSSSNPTSTSTSSMPPPAMKIPQRPFQTTQQPSSQSQAPSIKPTSTQNAGYQSSTSTSNYSSNHHQDAHQYSSAPQYTQSQSQSHQSTMRNTHSIDKDLDADPYGAPSIPSSSSSSFNSTSKLSNFINSTKPLPGSNAPDTEHYGRKSPLNHYSGNVDLS